MAVTLERLQNLESGMTRTLKPIFAVANIANPLVTALSFGIGMVFRFIKLGQQVRERKEEAQRLMDAAVRAEGIFRLPVRVEPDRMKMDPFIRRDLKRIYPIAHEQLQPELKIYGDESHPQWAEAAEILRLAVEVIPEVYLDLKFDDNPVLDDLFGKWLDPGNPQFGHMLRELKILLQNEEVSIPKLKELLPAYAHEAIKHYHLDLSPEQEEALTAMSEELSGFIFGELMGDSSATSEALSFVVQKREEALDAEIEDLLAKREELEGEALEGRSQPSKTIQQIDKRLEEINTMKERIASAV